MFPIYLRRAADDPAPDESIAFIVGKNGAFVHKRTSIFRATVTAKELPSLAEVKEEAEYLLPPIPAPQVMQILLFFRGVHEKFGTEAILLIAFNPQTGRYHLEAPEQVVTTAHCKYEMPQAPSDGLIYVGTVHSHGTMGAFHSGTDTHDEQFFDGIHLTFGRIRDEEIDIVATLAVSGKRFTQRVDHVLGGTRHQVHKEPERKPYVPFEHQQLTPLSAFTAAETQSQLEAASRIGALPVAAAVTNGSIIAKAATALVEFLSGKPPSAALPAPVAQVALVTREPEPHVLEPESTALVSTPEPIDLAAPVIIEKDPDTLRVILLEDAALISPSEGNGSKEEKDTGLDRFLPKRYRLPPRDQKLAPIHNLKWEFSDNDVSVVLKSHGIKPTKDLLALVTKALDLPRIGKYAEGIRGRVSYALSFRDQTIRARMEIEDQLVHGKVISGRRQFSLDDFESAKNKAQKQCEKRFFKQRPSQERVQDRQSGIGFRYPSPQSHSYQSYQPYQMQKEGYVIDLPPDMNWAECLPDPAWFDKVKSQQYGGSSYSSYGGGSPAYRNHWEKYYEDGVGDYPHLIED